ncbi:MAG TPA: protein kinase [Thermoanaerobaculia bacterium]|jgi:Tol biopolymer transport system component
MSLPQGTRLGPYEILAPIGAGGMGEVYRARDERLKRDVAIKVLPPSYSQDADRLRRFEHEAQSAGGLNHPNITAVYDFGSHEGAPYIVTELLEGETLRARLSGGAIAVRKAIEYAVQIARGLAAAHEKGVIHRDLKPENLFMTNDGRVKILDFGLAKLTQAEAQSGPQTNLPTATEPGVVMGTLGYMSPEQVKGKPADQRSDLFSFGAILYEMLSGVRAFHRDSAAETMSAILREEPPDLSATNKSVQPGLERIVRHCLEKNPEERFYSARDVAFDLEALSGLSGTTAAASVGPSPRRRLLPMLVVAAILASLAIGYGIGRGRGATTPLAFRQLTFRRGTVWSARFGVDGKTAFYSASWDGAPTEIYVSAPGSPESRPLGISGADVLAVSSAGDLAMALESRVSTEFARTGTLARASATGGGAPRQILEGVESADWAPNGQDLAVVRNVGGQARLEYPIGKPIYETRGWISSPRISRDGGRIAFIDHPNAGDDGGFAAVVDRAGKKTRLSAPFGSAQGLAWSPDGSEIWFTAAEVGNRSLYAVSLSGKLRLLARVTGSLTMQDAARDGRVLLIDETRRLGLSVLSPGAAKERELSWLDWSRPVGLSRDGKTTLFYESGEGGGAGYSTYVRDTDGSPAVRLGEGQALALSPDGKWAVALLHKLTDAHLVLYPTGAGQPRRLTLPGLHFNLGATRFLQDSRHFLITANEEGRGDRVYLLDLDGGKPRAITPENFRGPGPISSDGKRFLVRAPDGKPVAYPIEGGEPTALAGLEAGDLPVGWTADDRGLFVQRSGAPAAKIERLDPATGRAEPWREILPSDATGVVRVSSVLVSPDGTFYAYAYSRVLSNLFLAEGLK